VRVGIVTFPIDKAGITPLSNVINILHSLADDTHIITGNAGAGLSHYFNESHFHLVSHKSSSNPLGRMGNYTLTQLKILLELAKLSGKVDVWLFPIGGDALTPTMLLAKLLRKPVILALTSSAEKMFGTQKDRLTKVVILLVKINYALASRIILYSDNLIEDWHLGKYRDKVSIAHEHIVDFDNFNVQRPLKDRDNLVGYIGRLSAEKGILNFIEAMPLILHDKPETQILIGGDGKLKGVVEVIFATMPSLALNKDTNYIGWIPRDQLPTYLNELKLLIIPSHTEGLPNIMLEAMACGIPILATVVGTIPEIIKDGETGFILKDTSPEAIAEDIKRALGNPNLDKIARNAWELVRKEYTWKAAIESYQNIFTNLGYLPK